MIRQTMGNPVPGARPWSRREYTRNLEGKTKIVRGAFVDLPDRAGHVNAGKVARLWGLDRDPEVLLLEPGQAIPDGQWDVYTLDRQGEPEMVTVGQKAVEVEPVEQTPVEPVPAQEGPWPMEAAGAPEESLEASVARLGISPAEYFVESPETPEAGAQGYLGA